MRVFVYEYLSAGGDPSLADALRGHASAPQGAPADQHLQDARDLLQAGRAMRDALVDELREDGVELCCACADAADARAVQARGGTVLQALQVVEAVWPQAGETALDFVRREAARHDRAWIVAPESDGLLAQFAAGVEPSRWVGCSRDALHLASRKRATLARLAAHGVPTPLAFDTEARHWIVKPDDGAGCIDTLRHASRDAAFADLRARREAGANATLEPFIEGQPMSLSLLCGPALPGGFELLAIHHQMIALRPEASAGEGRLRLHDEGVAIDREPRVGPRAEALRALARSVVAAVPGLRGFVGIDLVWHAQHGPVLIEVNPRLTSAFVGLSAALGRRVAAEVLATFAKPAKPAESTKEAPLAGR